MFCLQAIHRQQIIAHAERAYPEECCGILLGTIDRQTHRKNLVEVIETQNAWSEDADAAVQAILPSASQQQDAASRRDRYWIDPRDLLAAQKRGRDCTSVDSSVPQLQVIGIYHSHPDHAAVPSECDRLLAWAEYSYLIVSVQQHQAVDLQCWSLDEQHQFLSEAISEVSKDGV
ncbi:M67 family metallopeptidase [Phormidium tenue FACHB-886]|nr:M67 family metallopeptidase [Phormidium tenue FACHB-886]